MEGWREGEMVGERDGFLPSNRALITKQHSPVPTVGGPGRLSPGGRLMMLV